VTIILDAHQGSTAVTKLHFDPRRAGIERIFHELLHHRSRPLDDLASGDLIGDPVRKDADFGHACSPLGRLFAALRQYTPEPSRFVALFVAPWW
jgi:hypothetical protein